MTNRRARFGGVAPWVLAWTIWAAACAPAHADTARGALGRVVPIPSYEVDLGTRTLRFGNVARPRVASLAECEAKREAFYRNARRQIEILLPDQPRYRLTLTLVCVEGNDRTVFVQTPETRYTVAPGN